MVGRLVMESILVVGTNHQHAPVEWRERMAWQGDQATGALRALYACGYPVVILSTCNRLEFYAAVADECGPQEQIQDFVSRHAGLSRDEIRAHFYHHRDAAAVRHLFAVAAGLDSMLIGEAEILGQVVDALELAQRERTANPVLTRLFQQAISTGKAARSRTRIGDGGVSLGHAAVELARTVFGDAVPGSVLVIGAGKMADSIVRHLAANDVRSILVANRTYARARELAGKFGGRALHFGSIPDAIAEADLVIASSAAPHVVIHYDEVHQAMSARRERPLVLVDIAVPRDIDPRVAHIEGVRLFDIDDLRSLCDGTLARRQREADKVRAIVISETADFMHWLAERASAPTIAAIYQRAEQLREQEVARTLRHIGGLTPEQSAAIDTLTRSLVRKLLHEPVKHLKQPRNGRSQREYVDLVRTLFALDAREEP